MYDESINIIMIIDTKAVGLAISIIIRASFIFMALVPRPLKTKPKEQGHAAASVINHLADDVKQSAGREFDEEVSSQCRQAESKFLPPIMVRFLLRRSSFSDDLLPLLLVMVVNAEMESV